MNILELAGSINASSQPAYYRGCFQGIVFTKKSQERWRNIKMGRNGSERSLTLQQGRVHNQRHVVTIQFGSHGNLGHSVIAGNQENSPAKVPSFAVGRKKRPKCIIGVQNGRKLIIVVTPILLLVSRQVRRGKPLLNFLQVTILLINREWIVRRYSQQHLELRVRVGRGIYGEVVPKQLFVAILCCARESIKGVKLPNYASGPVKARPRSSTIIMTTLGGVGDVLKKGPGTSGVSSLGRRGY